MTAITIVSSNPSDLVKEIGLLISFVAVKTGSKK